MSDSGAQPPARVRSALGLLASLALVALVAAAGALATASGLKAWYPGLEKPAFNPPNWVFAPVWTTLYLMMAIAAWRIWLKPRGAPGRAGALALYGLQLALNLAWSFIFFGARRPGAAFAEIVALWAALAATIWAFRRLSTPAGLLLLPYAAWTTYAALLNFEVWRLN